MAIALDRTAYKPDIYYHKQDGELVAGPMPPHPNFGRLISRPALHRALMEALKAENVAIRCEARLSRYWETENEAATLSPKDALEQLDEEGQWGADLRAAIAATPQNHIVDWRFMRRELKREWASPKGRLIQVGDAAHPFLPTTVNGGTQALEDGVSLVRCLRLAVEKHGVGALPDGAKVHNALRIDRVAAIESTGMERTSKHRQIDFEKVKKNLELMRNELALWQTEHDPQIYAEEQFDDCFACLKSGKVFVNTNKPAEYVFKP
jgi:2-polyprenyl-6-methoxyphenol hydroxylase-like FAD-dependent oxidoreductase